MKKSIFFARSAVITPVLLLAAQAAFAQAAPAPDTSPVTTAITAAGAALSVVGAAYVAMRYGASVWKWLTKFAG